MMKSIKLLIPLMLVLLALAGCNKTDTKEETSSVVEETEETVPVEEVPEETSEEEDSEETTYTSDAYEYQQLESILRVLKEETEQ